MPISDGYDACKNILKLYNDKVRNIAHMKPLIVACTSYLDDDVIKKTNQDGFDAAYVSPISKD